MAVTDIEHERLGRAFQALTDPTRQKILILLADQPLSVFQIVEQFSLAQPTISRHLAILRNARLVRATRSRQRMIYDITVHGHRAVRLMNPESELCPA